jgi:hypothetical protein
MTARVDHEAERALRRLVRALRQVDECAGGCVPLGDAGDGAHGRELVRAYRAARATLRRLDQRPN